MEKFCFSSTLVGKQIALINFLDFRLQIYAFPLASVVTIYRLNSMRETRSLLALFEEWWLTKYRLQRKQVVSIQRIYLLLPFPLP